MWYVLGYNARNRVLYFFEGESLMACDDVLAGSITTTGTSRRSTGDLSTATEEASERLYRARDAPPFWRAGPDQVMRRQFRCGRRRDRCGCRRSRLDGRLLLLLRLRLLGVDNGRCHLRDGGSGITGMAGIIRGGQL